MLCPGVRLPEWTATHDNLSHLTPASLVLRKTDNKIGKKAPETTKEAIVNEHKNPPFLVDEDCNLANAISTKPHIMSQK